MKMKKRFLGILFSLVMVLGLMPGMSLTAKADGTTVTTADGFKTAVGNGGSISLGSDITLTLDDNLSFNQVTTTDLNGHTLTLNSEKRFSVDAQVIIKDGVGNGKITTSHDNSLFVIRDGGSMKLEGGTLENTNSAAQVIDVWTGPFTMTGGMIKSSGKSIWRDGARVTISGGTIIGDLKGSSGIIDITGGKFSFDPSSLLSSEYKSAKAGEYWVVSAAHTHSFTYSSSGATITATCGNTGCTLTANPTLTIVKPTLETYGQTGKSAVATLDGLADFNTATGKTIAETNITYVGRDGTNYAESATAPTNAGKYTAKITVEGVTASVNYTVSVPVTGVALDPGEVTVAVGDTQKLTATIAPGNATDKRVKWKANGDDGEIAFYSDEACTMPVAQETATDLLTVYIKGVSPSSGSGLKIDVDSVSAAGKHASCYVKVSKANAVTATVTANNRTYDGTEKPLVTVDNSTLVGGTMQYALGADTTTAPTEGWGTSIPTKADAGTYYVWYKVKGDENHNDTAPADPVTVTISAAEIVTISFDAAGGTGTMTPVQIEKGSQYTLPNSSFIPPANHVFAHWKIGEKSYAVNDGITVNADLTVTAVWTEEKSEDKESKIVPADLTSVPDELKNKFSSIKDLKDALLRELSSKGMFTSEENSVFYDVVLMVRRNGGPWVPATKEDFENGPLTVKLDYPTGTGRDTHNFKVAHMFTMEMPGCIPGKIETPQVTKLEDGIQVELNGLSPVAISWTKIDEKAIDSLPQTGDTERPLLYGLIALLACIGIGWMTRKK